MSEEKEELKSCPFCGAKPEEGDVIISDKIIIEGEYSRDDVLIEKRAECLSCGALGPSADREEGVRKYWNERKENES